MKQNIRNSTRLKTSRRFVADKSLYAWWLRSVYDSCCECFAYVSFFGTINPIEVYYEGPCDYALFACMI